MTDFYEIRFCETCKKDTRHRVEEHALEIEYQCEVCNQTKDMVKTFF